MRANYQPEMFWNRVEQLRRMKGITMQELGGKIGKSPSAMRSMMAEKRMMRLQEALAIADCFGCSISYLFFGTPDHRDSSGVQEEAKKRGVASGGLISAVYANEGRPIRDQLNGLIPYLNARQCRLLMDYLSLIFGVSAKVDESVQEEVRTGSSQVYVRSGYGDDYAKLRDNFRRNLNNYLDRNGLSYTRFAESIGLPRTTITDCLKKENLYGMVSTYGIIAEACGWSLKQMLSEDPTRPDIDDGAVMDDSTWNLVRQELQETHSSKTHLLNIVNLEPESDSYAQFSALNEMRTTILKVITSLAVGF
jgi:DNA-binding XRE family transcriptional regulator